MPFEVKIKRSAEKEMDRLPGAFILAVMGSEAVQQGVGHSWPSLRHRSVFTITGSFFTSAYCSEIAEAIVAQLEEVWSLKIFRRARQVDQEWSTPFRASMPKRIAR